MTTVFASGRFSQPLQPRVSALGLQLSTWATPAQRLNDALHTTAEQVPLSALFNHQDVHSFLSKMPVTQVVPKECQVRISPCSLCGTRLVL